MKPVRMAPERGQQPVRVAALQVTLDPFGTQHATIDREVLPGLKPDHGVVLDLELDAALHAAETAMRLDESIRRRAPLPPPWGPVVDISTVLLYNLPQRWRNSRHRHTSPVIKQDTSVEDCILTTNH